MKEMFKAFLCVMFYSFLFVCGMQVVYQVTKIHITANMLRTIDNKGSTLPGPRSLGNMSSCKGNRVIKLLLSKLLLR